MINIFVTLGDGLYDLLLQRCRAGRDSGPARYVGSEIYRAHSTNGCARPELGSPHTKAFGDGLFELRLKGAEGIARVFFCTLVAKRIVMLHSFIKKSDKTPLREREIAEARLKEVKDAYA